ncbi:MAG: putative SpoIIIJ-associated protein Jag [Dehalococcoidia bacterium]|nr:putative SpoIIIJ-associated protein Jag [Dehalococcoidia bacterium]
MENQFSGKTVEEAIQTALDQLGVSREAVEVSIINEGRAGILGLGSEPAVVRVTPLAAMPQVDVAGAAKAVLEKLLGMLGMEGTVTTRTETMPEEAPSITLDVTGPDLGILIGRRGQTLASLQYLVRLMVSNETKSRESIIIDIEGYKERRYLALESLARQMAEQVKMQGKPYAFEPMSSFERRIIHVTLTGDPDVTTESVGIGEGRKVILMPKKMAE